MHFWRRLGQRRLVASVAAITLGAGVGVSAAVFSLVDGIFLRPLPVLAPERILVVRPIRPSAPNDRVAYSMADYHGFRAATHAFSALAAMDMNGAFPQPVGPPDNAELVNATWITGGLTNTLGVVPVIGRGLDSADRNGGPGSGVALSYRYWQRAYGGDPAVVGQSIRVFGLTHVIRGVLPRGFDFPRGTDIWVPMPETLKGGLVVLVGRLAPGATAAQARAELDGFMTGPGSPDPPVMRDFKAATEPLETAVTGSARPIMLALGAGVALLLFMTIVNAAFLVVSRALGRQRDVAVRRALGAGPRQATALLVRECLVMAGVGAILAIAIAELVLRGLLALAPPELPRLDAVSFGWNTLAYSLAFSLLLGATLGAVAARVATQSRPEGLLGHRAPATSAHWWMRYLVITQIAGAVVVLAGAGLTLRSLDAMTHVDLGFAPNNLLIGRLYPGSAGYTSDTAWPRALSRTLAAIKTLPGVTDATPVIAPPFTGQTGWDITYILDGQADDALRTNPLVALYTASPESFRVLGIPLLAGRAFTSIDSGAANPTAVIVSAHLAATLWPGKNPLGQRIKVDIPAPWATVVGVVADTRYRDLGAVRGTLYLPYAEAGITAFALAVRTRGNPAAMVAPIRRLVNSTDPNIRLSGLVPAMTLTEPVLARFRFAALLLSAVAGAALLLAVAGLYGAMATLVEQRKQEIGIRIALGALPRTVLALVARQGALLTVGGLVLGGTVAWAGGRLIGALLYQVTATDPATFVGVICLIVLVAVAASLIPARRATRVDPLTVLKAE